MSSNVALLHEGWKQVHMWRSTKKEISVKDLCARGMEANAALSLIEFLVSKGLVALYVYNNILAQKRIDKKAQAAGASKHEPPKPPRSA